MKKWVLPVLLLLLLVACNSQPQEENVQANDEEEPVKVEDQNEEIENNAEEDEPASTHEKEEKPDDVDSPENNEDGGEEETSTDPVTNGNESQDHQYTVNPEDSSIQPIGDANPDVVLLTIDDAPDRYALEMATTLKELGVKAIFFVNGHFIHTEKEHAVLKEIYEMGFPIGNHTMKHKNLNQQTEEEQYEDIVGLNNLIEEITGERPKFFRAPYGENTDYARELVKSEGMLLMNWTYGYDWEKDYKTPEALTDIMVNAEELRSGANLLMHDREWTNEALGDIVKGLQEKGYEMVDPMLIEGATEE
jgi:peptidoglycan/xylan/chitin deacetylase (PgdA/CDA1 family)